MEEGEAEEKKEKEKETGKGKGEKEIFERKDNFEELGAGRKEEAAERGEGERVSER